MRSVKILFLLVGVLGIPAIARAQASITGVVRDTSGAVLPGVIVEVASDVLIEKVRVATSDGTTHSRRRHGFADSPVAICRHPLRGFVL